MFYIFVRGVDDRIALFVKFLFFIILSRDHADGGNGVVLAQVYQLDALGVASENAEGVHVESDGNAGAVDNHQVVIVGHILEGDKIAGLFGDLDGADTLAATVGDAVVLEEGAFAEAVLGDDEHVAALVVDGQHATLHSP